MAISNVSFQARVRAVIQLSVDEHIVVIETLAPFAGKTLTYSLSGGARPPAVASRFTLTASIDTAP